MDQTSNEILQLMNVIPFIEVANKEYIASRLPLLSEENRVKIRTELWITVKELLANIPFSSFGSESFTDEEKRKILTIQSAYLQELQDIDKELKSRFYKYQNKTEAQEKIEVETLLNSFLHKA